MAKPTKKTGKKKKHEAKTQHGWLFSKPSFFKVLIGDFSKKVKIPTKFARKCLDEYVGKNRVNLVTYRGSWGCQHKYYIKKGWKVFVRENELEFSDFLVFYLTKPCTLSVVLYDKTACGKNMLDLIGRKRKRRSPGPKKKLVSHDERLCYELCATLKDSNRYYMYMPKAFMDESGLAKMTEVEITTKDGRCWPVTILEKQRFSRGWGRIWRENKLKPGIKCMFRCTWNTNRSRVKIEILKLDGKKKKATIKDEPIELF